MYGSCGALGTPAYTTAARKAANAEVTTATAAAAESFVALLGAGAGAEPGLPAGTAAAVAGHAAYVQAAWFCNRRENAT